MKKKNKEVIILESIIQDDVLPKIRRRYNSRNTIKKFEKNENALGDMLIKPLTKEDLKIAEAVGKQRQSYFRMVDADVDLSKMSNAQRIDYLRNNPDVEEELESSPDVEVKDE